jgi:hypothetical protein
MTLTTPNPSSAQVKVRVDLYLSSPSVSSRQVIEWFIPSPLPHHFLICCAPTITVGFYQLVVNFDGRNVPRPCSAHHITNFAEHRLFPCTVSDTCAICWYVVTPTTSVKCDRKIKCLIKAKISVYGNLTYWPRFPNNADGFKGGHI